MKFELIKDDMWLSTKKGKFWAVGTRYECHIRYLSETESEISVYSGSSFAPNTNDVFYTKEDILKEFCKFAKIPFKSTKQVVPKGNPYWHFYHFPTEKYNWKKFMKEVAPIVEENRIAELADQLAEISSEDLKKVIKYRLR